jgi:hypothetical protein
MLEPWSPAMLQGSAGDRRFTRHLAQLGLYGPLYGLRSIPGNRP